MSTVVTTSPSTVSEAEPEAPVGVLPRWPLVALFAPFALWWVLGLIDLILIPLAAVMILYLLVVPGTKVPRGFGLWMLFLLWAGCSIIELSSFDQTIGFGYRYAMYLSATVLFIYVYNARAHLSARYTLGVLTIVWLTVVVGGYLGLLMPYTAVHTPMTHLVSQQWLNNDLINHMFIRRFSQANGAAFGLAPRPSAPFRYTNNWGNAYSVLLPLVVTYALMTTRIRRRLILGVALPVSAVPALLTLNRGMLLGIGLVVVYTSIRLAMMRRYGAVLLTGLAAFIGLLVFLVLPVQERNQQRLENENLSSTNTRESLYSQAFATVPSSPFFGHGSPVEGSNPNAPPVGTHGQIWIFLVSHGPIATTAAMGWFALVCWQTRKRRDVAGLGSHVATVVATIELTYYGAVPYGLPVLMVAAALALRPEPQSALIAIPRFREPAPADAERA